ncbi:MAG: GWxTD domain-containing protein [Candidatus Latescibacteria bacterium]|nr:GWxTD domain-containing protein [Candidatus Latescibacterota bacterium]MBT4136861.1 GWxTD domain-containing protein [Candidatus Latescibacterota bacterium]
MSVSLRGWCVVLAGCLLMFAPLRAEDAVVPDEPPKTLAYRNTMLALGERQFKAGEINESLETFKSLVVDFPDDAHLHTRLGYVLLKRDDFKEAEAAFHQAKKLDKGKVEAYVGLGLTYAEKPTRGIESLYNFRRAIAEAKRATKINPSYGPAYRLLGEVYERFEEDHTRALSYYAKYVELEPDNPEGLYYFGLAAIQAKEYGQIVTHISPYIQNHPEIVQLLPIVSQGHFYNDEPQKALEFFERFLQNIEGSERQHYTQISYIASDLELAEYETLVGPEKLAYREQFWARRDPDILTKINERVIEHYRRVWYARTFFSSNVYPWDKRGTVYIRYGEPDYRSRSTDLNFVQSPEVETVRMRMAVDIYGAEAAFLTFTGPVFPIRTNRQQKGSLFDPNTPDDNTDFSASDDIGGALDEQLGEIDAEEGGEGEGYRLGFERDPFSIDGSISSRLDDQSGRMNTRLQFGGYAPVTIDNEIDTVPWETWTFVQLNGGMEITFTDEMGNGRYDFAPLPEATFEDAEAISYITRMVEHTPDVLYQSAVSRTPDFYRPGLPGDVLNFYYDLAEFRGGDGQTQVEIYYGIPPEQVEAVETADSSFIHVQLAVAFADEGHTTIYRAAEEFFYQSNSALDKTKGAFVPELLSTQVPPGAYEVQVQMKDLISGRTGIYRQDLNIDDYRPAELQISDLQLASTISDTGATKFKKEDVWIIPMPTRSYAETQNVFAYFEIYNLTRDSFGQTRYKTEYKVRSSAMPSVGVFGAVTSGLRTIFKSSKAQVSITNEQVGRDIDQHEYVEIVLSKAKPGVNALEVTITDLVTGKSVDREVRFRYGK